MKSILFVPQFPEPNHKDFETLELAIEAKKNWERNKEMHQAISCPHCNSIHYTQNLTLTVYLKWDNDPYNPRPEEYKKEIQCIDASCGKSFSPPECKNYFKSIREMETK